MHRPGGAGRIELCGGLGEGGTTPSAGLIEVVRQHIDIDLYVMIRPRGGDFVYDVFEEEIMRKDIDLAKKLGANGVVLGILTADGQVDVAAYQSACRLCFSVKSHFPQSFRPNSRSCKSIEGRD
jgi:copper homeostasis protein